MAATNNSGLKAGNTQIKDSINIISYNLHGLMGQGKVLLKDLCSTKAAAAVIFVQEHWLTPMNMHLLHSFSPHYTAFGISAMEQAVSHSVLRGRPYGGVATLIHNDFIGRATCVKCAERYNIITVDNIIFINVYMPCNAPGSVEIVKSVLDDIENVICLFPDYNIVLGGDFNVDLTNTCHTSKAIQSFMSNHQLILCNDIIKPNCQYTYCHDSLQHQSMLDYFIMSRALTVDLYDCSILDNTINLSDHLPIRITLKWLSLPNDTRDTAAGINANNGSIHNHRLRWDHANLCDYYSLSYSALQPILNILDDLYGRLEATSHYKVYSEHECYREQVASTRPHAVTIIEVCL